MRVKGECHKVQLCSVQCHNKQPFGALGLPREPEEEVKKLTKHKQKIRFTETIRSTKRPKKLSSIK